MEPADHIAIHLACSNNIIQHVFQLTYIVVQYRLYTGAIFHFKLMKH